MADLKISELAAAASASGTQQIPVNESGTTKRVTLAQVLAYIEGAIGTAAFRALLDDADSAALRTTIGAQAPATTLAGYGITDAQPLDSDLTAIAALTTTAYGRSVLALADAAALRALGGLIIGTDVQPYSALTALNTSQALTDAATIAWNVALGALGTVTLGGNRTIANPTNLQAGASYALKVTQDGTGNRTLAYGNAYKWAGGVAPTLSTVAGAVDVLTFISDGTNMYGSILKAFA